MTGLSALERVVLSHAGVPAQQLAEAIDKPVSDVRRIRHARGRDDEDGNPRAGVVDDRRDRRELDDEDLRPGGIASLMRQRSSVCG